MKTQILQLEPHDDLISIRDRMSWAKTPRVLLVNPRKGRIDLRPLDMTLIQRHAKTLGLQIAFVTKDRELKRAAALNGIVVFKTTADAQKAKWMSAPQTKLRPRKKNLNLRQVRDQLFPPPPAWTQNQNIRIGIFSAGVLSIVILLLAFLPSATIHATPALKTQSITLMINANPDAKQVYFSGNIPARKITAAVTGSKTINAIASDANRASLRQTLIDELNTSAKQKILANLKDGDLLFPATLQMIHTAAENFSTSNSQLTLEMQLEYAAYYAARDDLIALANGVLDASIPSGYAVLPASVKFAPASAFFSGPSGATNWQMNFTREMQAQIDPLDMIWASRGLIANAVPQTLMDRFALSDVQIDLAPSWWLWMPLVPMRIEVVN
jgi:hypothetical protein